MKINKLEFISHKLIFLSLFQVVDMRWGVRDEATDDHMTTELCMREIVRQFITRFTPEHS